MSNLRGQPSHATLADFRHEGSLRSNETNFLREATLIPSNCCFCMAISSIASRNTTGSFVAMASCSSVANAQVGVSARMLPIDEPGWLYFDLRTSNGPLIMVSPSSKSSLSMKIRPKAGGTGSSI